MGGFSLWHWLIVLVIVVLVFGTKRLGNIGKDLGDAVKGFKKGMQDDDSKPDQSRAAKLGDESQRNATSETQRSAPDETPRDRDDQAR